MKQATLPQGTIHYREAGTGEPIVLVHGLLANGELWREVMPRLAADFRVIAPDLPLGAHSVPLAPGVDLSPPGQAAIIADFLAALDLRDVTLVGNDTGGALCQLVVAHHPERLARLVLTPCDAFEVFPPAMFAPLLAAARVPGTLYAIGQSLRPAPARRLPFAYGWVMKRFDAELTRSWIEPALSSRAIRRELAAFLRSADKRHTLEAAERFADFKKPVLLAWASEDRFFKLPLAERLAQAFPDARLELIEDSYTFVPLDQPQRTAELIASFAREPALAH
jgi:pimeloyl-ACP methyl ester carboxylesterase